jgi:hypothetical protein
MENFNFSITLYLSVEGSKQEEQRGNRILFYRHSTFEIAALKKNP